MIDLKNKNEILFLAEKVVYYNELLINHTWLSAEEGNKNMEEYLIKLYKQKENRLLKWLKIHLGIIIGISQ